MTFLMLRNQRGQASQRARRDRASPKHVPKPNAPNSMPRLSPVNNKKWSFVKHRTRKASGKICLGAGVPSLLERLGQVLDRCRLSLLGGRKRLQKEQRRALVQLGEQLQSRRVVRFEAGRQLVHQPGLTLDQAVLVAGQGFEFSDQGTVMLQSPQIRQFRIEKS